MFKGIITRVGIVKDIFLSSSNDYIFFIQSSKLEGIKISDSIACDGVCLTVVDIKNDIFCVCASKETLKVSILGNWKKNTKVNIELSLKLIDGVDGHLVQGHVDGIAKIVSISKINESHEIKLLLLNKDLTKYIAKKGSIAVNGVSLTVNLIERMEFIVNIIPYTWYNTNFQYSQINDIVNIETDLIARYLERLIKTDF